MKTRIVCLLLILSCPGCAELLPDAIPVEASHVSHLSQHFKEHPTNYGYDAVYAGLKWKRGDLSLKLEEGYVIGRLDGMHEVTQVTLEYDIPLHK